MTSELRAGWWSRPSEQTLTLPVDASPAGACPDRALPDHGQKRDCEARIVPLQPGPALEERDSGVEERTAPKGHGGLKGRLVALDIVAVTATWLIVGTFDVPAGAEDRRWVAVASAIAVTLAVVPLLGLYRSRVCAQRGQQSRQIILAAIGGALAFEVIRQGGDRGVGLTFVAAGSCVVAVIVGRWAFEQWLSAQRARGRFLRGIVLIGTNDDAVDVCTMLHAQPELGYEVRGVIGADRSHSDWVSVPRSQDLDDLPDVAKKTQSTGVLVVANALSAADVRHVIDLSSSSGLHIQVCPGFRGLATRRVRRLPMSGEVFLYVEPGRRETWQRMTKQAIDTIGAVIGLVITAPILLIAWIAIRLEDGGPALYRQVRVGLNEQPFQVYKLRSMARGSEKCLDAMDVVNERTDGPLFKATCDPRVTRVGAVIRALSIDELPQLFNVLVGQMSLVGPRPALPREVAQFDSEHLRRHCVKPGLTGLWQLEARDNPSFHAYRRLDLLYVDNWSIGLDLLILLATVPMVIARGLRAHRPAPETAEESCET